jgi:hypothetical protein
LQNRECSYCNIPSKPHVAGLFGSGCMKFVPSPKFYKSIAQTNTAKPPLYNMNLYPLMKATQRVALGN